MSSKVLVTIKQGTLRGNEETTHNNFKFFTFMGIPYAKPPVGKLKFKVSANNKSLNQNVK